MNEREPYLPGLEPDNERIIEDETNFVDLGSVTENEKVQRQEKEVADVVIVGENEKQKENDISHENTQSLTDLEKWEVEVDKCAECDKYGRACPRHMATKPF